VITTLLLSPSLLRYKKKKKATITLLPSPFVLQNKPRKEGDSSKVVVTFFVALQQNEKKR